MMAAGAGSSSHEVVMSRRTTVVPPGFRFHPTDEELLDYYLRKKVSYEAIDLDVIREVDLNKLEPWDLKEKCRIGSGPDQNEWYLFSHKDKKYPTGTRTNRATTAGFWKATGRDKAIHGRHLSYIINSNSNKRIGMRKTLVFYIGRAPHGQKTDWIMHEYRLDEDHCDFENNNVHQNIQEDGWVVCRVFKKKSNNMIMSNNIRNGFQPATAHDHHHHELVLDHNHVHHDLSNTSPDQIVMKVLRPTAKHEMNSQAAVYSSSVLVGNHQQYSSSYRSCSNMHLPQLLSPTTSTTTHHDRINAVGASCSLNTMQQQQQQDYSSCNSLNISCLTSSGGGRGGGGQLGQYFNNINELEKKLMLSSSSSDWTFLDKLLAASSSSSSGGHLQSSFFDHDQPAAAAAVANNKLFQSFMNNTTS